MNIKQAIILAAGLGTRMGKASDHTPKALLKLAGRPLIDYIIGSLREAEIENIFVTAHAHADQIMRHLEKTAPEIIISDERGQLMNTGGGVAKAFSLLQDAPFFTHNCDSIFPKNNFFKKMAQGFDSQKMDALLLLAASRTGSGDFFLKENGQAEQSQKNQSGDYVYTGVQILSPALMRGLPAGSFVMDVFWQRAQNAGRLFGHVLSEPWLHVGSADELQQAEKFLSPPMRGPNR